METLAIFNALLRDLQNLGAALAWLGLLYFIPAVIVTIIAAARTEPTQWRDLVPGAFGGFIIGVPVWAFALYFSGALWQRWSPRYHNGVAIGFFFATMGLAMLVQYCVLVIHYFRPLIKQRRERLRDPRSSPAKRRFVFSLRNILLLQIGLAIAFGLWWGIRRNGILSDYHYRKEKAEWTVHEATIHARFGEVGWRIAASQYSGLELQQPYRTPLPGFSEAVLKQLMPADRLMFLELRNDALTDAGLEVLSQQERIKWLDLQSEQVTDKGIAHLKKLKSLTYLTLDCPQLTEQVLADLQEIESLEHITLYRSPIPPERGEAFRQVRPNVKLSIYKYTSN